MGASVALHGAVLAFGPHVRAAHIEPPQVLSVVLEQVRAPAPRVEAPPALQEPPKPEPRAEAPPAPQEPPKPEPRRERARARPTPAPQPAPRREPEPVAAPAATAPMPQESESPAPREDARASTPSPAPPAVAAREPVSAPDFRAAYLNNPPPPYPRAARRNGEEGTVTLRVLVNQDGLPTQVELERSSGSSLLDTAAREAVKNWRFAPARRAGAPIAAWVIVPVIFRLTPES
jgi:protein TonB